MGAIQEFLQEYPDTEPERLVTAEGCWSRDWWWCVCIKNDCTAHFVGPYREREDAEQEASGYCTNAHAVQLGKPKSAVSLTWEKVPPAQEGKKEALAHNKEIQKKRLEERYPPIGGVGTVATRGIDVWFVDPQLGRLL